MPKLIEPLEMLLKSNVRLMFYEKTKPKKLLVFYMISSEKDTLLMPSANGRIDAMVDRPNFDNPIFYQYVASNGILYSDGAIFIELEDIKTGKTAVTNFGIYNQRREKPNDYLLLNEVPTIDFINRKKEMEKANNDYISKHQDIIHSLRRI